MAEKIHLEAIESTNLGAIGYNPHKQILAVQFAKTGVIFHYAGISNELMTRFLASESYGRFYAQNIRGRFQAARMSGPCQKCGAEGWVGDVCDDCGTATYQAVPYTPKEAPAQEEPIDAEPVVEGDLPAEDPEASDE
jgi:hypothetical protein